MKINFLVNEVFNGWEPTDTRLGGTEESVVKWAEGLVRRGHEVSVRRNTTGKGNYIHNGVVYKDRFSSDLHDICINVKSSDTKPFDKPMIYLTNETDATSKDLSLYNAVVWPSQWAKDNISVNNDKVYVVPHGYDNKQIYPGKKVNKQCFYASSPDRGLDALLEAWPTVMAAHPDATLLLTYGAQAPSLPGVINLGEVDEETMNEIYKTSDIWCHPCSGGELYCITGVKAQAAGCVPVIIPTMALAETVKHYFSAIKDNYADVLTATLSADASREAMREQLAKQHYPTWSDSTEELLKVIDLVVGSP